MKFRPCTDQLNMPDGEEFTEQDVLPKGLFGELLALLDRIEITGDAELASQRHAIAEKYGLTVEIEGPASSSDH